MKSRGYIETLGYVAAIEAADTMLKAANITILDQKIIGGGYITIIIEGDVGAVKAAIDAGVEAAQKVGKLVSAHVIARPASDIEKL